MLNQLPPSQRQQALDALEQLNRQQANNQPSSTLSEPVSEPPRITDEELQALLAAQEEPKAEGGSRLVIALTPRQDLNRAERTELERDPTLNRISGSQYYELDKSGVLVLPGLPNIPLLGLTESAIQTRLGAEPALKSFDIAVSLLDVKSAARDVLKPFGYDVFENPMTGLQPVTTGPVPPDYVLGPGDSVRVQLFGNVNNIYEFEVSRDGVLNLPELGPITVAGLPFSEFREDLKRRVEQMLIGTQVSVTMGQLRTIRVFVLGDAKRPGSYVVSSLATISSALYASGGVSEIGSLRQIELKRDGRTITKLDLYDLLLKGDTSGNRRLQPGDVIFVPPIGPTAGAGGAVRRPAIYELAGPTSAAALVELAGGLRADAFAAAARIERIGSDGNRRVVSVDVGKGPTSAMPMADGDTLIVPEVLPDLRDSVELAGHVHRPGPYELRPGMRLTDLLPSPQLLLDGADTGYVLLRRQDNHNRTHVKSANLRKAWDNPASAENVALQSRDTVHIFGLEFGRQRVIRPLLAELELQARTGEPFNEVSVSGSVKAPGIYPYESGMRVSDLVLAGGDLAEEAYTLQAELARYEVTAGEYRTSEVIDVDLAAVLRGDETANLLLQPHDNLRINQVPQWDTLWTVELEGEVKFPGFYRVRRGETLREVVARAGGLTDEAYPDGAVFLRESLRVREQEQIDSLIYRMQADLTALSLETLDTTGAEAMETGESLLRQLRTTVPVGRLVIEPKALMPDATGRREAGNIELQDGDRLLVPRRPQEVTVIGETQQNASHLYRSGLVRDDYIEMSGGLTRRADKKLIYVVRASGAVVAANQSRWFGRGGGTEIRPGDTIVVPLDTNRMRPLTFWTNVTQILYQGAIAVAAVRTFDNN